MRVSMNGAQAVVGGGPTIGECACGCMLQRTRKTGPDRAAPCVGRIAVPSDF